MDNLLNTRFDKILLIQYQPFGDVLLNTGYLPALRERFPDSRIDFLVRKPYHNAILDNPNLDNLITFENGKGLRYLLNRIQLIKKIRSVKYDLVIDQIRNAGSAQITFFSGAPFRLGWTHQRWKFLYNLRAERKKLRYYSAMKFDLLNPLGIREVAHSLYINIRQESYNYVDSWLKKKGLTGKKILCFSPGSPVKAKQWSEKCFAEVADKIISELKFDVIFLWAPKEKPDVENVLAHMEYKNKAVIAPATNFNQAAAVLKRSSLLICNDGGINHLSVATQTPSIAIFSKHKPTRWSPAGIHKNHFHFYNENADYINDKTFGININLVFEKIKDIFAE